MLPYYGDVALMKKAVESVLSQSHTDLRLVVLDDGYPDPEPARWFASLSDPRVTYLRNDVNVGANGNYRKALGLVEAEWFVMMGADDVMRPGYLSAVGRAAREGVDIIQPRVEILDEYDRRILPLADRVKAWLSPSVPPGGSVAAGEPLAVSLLRGNWAYFPAVAWRTAAVRRVGFRTDLDVAQDLALLLDIVADGGRLALLPDTLFDYRRHSRSDSSVRAVDGRRFAEERRFFQQEAKRFRRMGWKRAARAARLHVTSRMNAAATLPQALKAKRSPMPLLTHVIR
ncbi:glycosyltransferase [Microbacterium sp. ABRD28]|nr:glycosyltransferase [Microbacterium sp. ABRD28]